VALDADYDYFSEFNDVNLALEYIYVLFGAGGDIFERDLSVKLALTYIRIWTTSSDPYSWVGGEPDALDEFRDYWVANHNPGQPGFVERDLAHLLSSRSINGWAWGGTLCDYHGNGGYSCSGGNHKLSTLADNLLHDVSIVFHELGHNHNAAHTHCFDPPIDRCVQTCDGQSQDCSTAPSTIMSYCHHCPGGRTNILHSFHPLNVARMRPHIDSSCIRIVLNPCYVDWQNTSGTENGGPVYPYNTVKECVEVVVPGGTVIIANGNYPEEIPVIGRFSVWQPMTLTAPGGNVTIGD
jgi:hypothetical protein